MARRIIAAVLGLVCLWGIIGLPKAKASVHTYKNAPFDSLGNAFIYWGGNEGLYASSAHLKGSGIADGRSYIKFSSEKQITFTRTVKSAASDSEVDMGGIVEAIVMEVNDQKKIGDHGVNYGVFTLCCTRDLAIQTGCTEGEVIKRFNSSDPDGPVSIPAKFEGSSTLTSIALETVPINKTGMYTLMFVACDPRLDGLVIDGITTWKNPMGYLPGRMAPYMTFYAFMSLAYMLLGLLWFLQYVRFWKDILQLQNWITAVIALGMSEMALWYFEYTNFNAKGRRPMGITMWAVTLGAVKKTVSRLLILVVSMGYGVVRPTLGGLTSKVVLLGATYFLAAESLDVVEHVGAINDPPGKGRVFFILPVAMLDAFFILWIFTSLSKTLEKLQARRRFAKLELYRKFTNSLAVAVIVSVPWIGYELYFTATDPYNERWQSWWIIQAFWYMLSFVLLVIICVLWAPSQNSTRYAYSEEVGEDFDEDEAIALTSGVSGKASTTVDPETSSAKPDAKERKPFSTDVFSLEDEPEEDKRD